MKTLEELGFELEDDYHFYVYCTESEKVIVFEDGDVKTPALKQTYVEIQYDGEVVYIYEELYFYTRQEKERHPALLSGEVVLAIANKVKEFKDAVTKNV